MGESALLTLAHSNLVATLAWFARSQRNFFEPHVTSNETLLAEVRALLFNWAGSHADPLKLTPVRRSAFISIRFPPLEPTYFFRFRRPSLGVPPASPSLPPLLFLEARWREEQDPGGRRWEARRGELRRGAPLTVPTAPGALSGGAGCNTTELRSPSLIYRHYVGQRWSIHLQLSSHKLKFMRAMVHSGERGSEPLCCDNLYLAKGSPLTLFYLLELKEMLWTEVDVQVSRSVWG